MIKPTRQDLFNTAYAGLKAQGFKQSLDSYGQCKYRGRGGLKCAVGHLIPDERYNSSFEGSGAASSDIAGMVGVGPENDNAAIFLIALQRAHDNCATPEQMQGNLREVAKKYELTIEGVPA